MMAILAATGTYTYFARPRNPVEGFEVKAHWTIKAYHQDGTLYDIRDFDILVTNLGRSYMMSCITGLTVTRPNTVIPTAVSCSQTVVIAIGTATASPSRDDSCLQNEVWRNGLFKSSASQVGTGNSAVVSATLGARLEATQGTGAITEAGLSWTTSTCSVSSPNIITRATFTAVNKSATDVLDLTVTLSYPASA